MKYTIAVGLLLFCLTGCDEINQALQTVNQPKPARTVHVFKPLPLTDGNLAFDETTGQKCRTWSWVCGCYSAAKQQADKDTADYTTQPIKDEDKKKILKDIEDTYIRDLGQCNEAHTYGMRCDAIGSIPICDSVK